MQEQVFELTCVNHTRSDDNEQYGRRLCLRIEGIECKENETTEEVFRNVSKIIKDKNMEIPDSVVDRAHRIGPTYMKDGKRFKSIIVRFTTFRHRTIFYHKARKLCTNFRTRLDLTKYRFNLLNSARSLVESNEKVNFVYADINCRLKVKPTEGSDLYFSTEEELRNILKDL